jgi:hypothetical protein
MAQRRSGSSVMKNIPHLHHALALVAVFALVACASRQQSETRASPTATEAQTLRVLGRTERPGLGTAWGEPRESWVAPAYFARAWDNRPSSLAKLFYNDREGVDAMLDHLGGEPRSVPGLQRAAGGLVRVGLRDGSGRWFETLELRDQRFTIGERGSRYEVVVKNESRKRLEVVLSVDGLDTFDGEAASFKKRGYVLGPRETLTVDGFRATDGSVAAFRFTNVGDTYAQRRHEQSGNVGVIGLAVFAERWFGASPAKLGPEHRAWKQVPPQDVPSSRRYATPPDA